MNWLVTISGIFAFFTVVGHFMVGSKAYLNPMLDASFDPVARKVMHCVFHYVSVFLILSAGTLLLIGTATWEFDGSAKLVQFIALNYAGFAVWQVILASTSGIPKGVFKLFQWVFFILISSFALIGVAVG